MRGKTSLAPLFEGTFPGREGFGRMWASAPTGSDYTAQAEVAGRENKSPAVRDLFRLYTDSVVTSEVLEEYFGNPTISTKLSPPLWILCEYYKKVGKIQFFGLILRKV